MTRFDTAYLEIEDASGTATFEMSIGLQTSGQMERNYIMGPRGQYVTEVYNQLAGLDDIDGTANRRAGFKIDGGAGEFTQSVSFQVGLEDVEWGDGSGGTGPTNVTARDASGADIKALTRKHILEIWVTQSRSDSDYPARLYFGEWTDGSPPGHSESGAFDQPFVGTVDRLTTDLADPNNDPPSELTGSVEVSMVTLFSDIEPPAYFDGSNLGTYSERAADALEDFADE